MGFVISAHWHTEAELASEGGQTCCADSLVLLLSNSAVNSCILAAIWLCGALECSIYNFKLAPVHLQNKFNLNQSYFPFTNLLLSSATAPAELD